MEKFYLYETVSVPGNIEQKDLSYYNYHEQNLLPNKYSFCGTLSK